MPKTDMHSHKDNIAMPWKVYSIHSNDYLFVHYICQCTAKQVSDTIHTIDGEFIIQKIDSEKRELWV